MPYLFRLSFFIIYFIFLFFIFFLFAVVVGLILDLLLVQEFPRKHQGDGKYSSVEKGRKGKFFSEFLTEMFKLFCTKHFALEKKDVFLLQSLSIIGAFLPHGNGK